MAGKCYGVKSITVKDSSGTRTVTPSKVVQLTITSDTTVTVNYAKTGQFILIDPGHGSLELNSFKVNGKKYYEYERMWVLSSYLVSYLNSYDNIYACRTKTTATATPGVYNRGLMAKNFDLFISLHSDWESSGKAQYAHIIVPYESKYYSKVKTLSTKLTSSLNSLIPTAAKRSPWTRTYYKNGKRYNYYGVIRGAAAVGTPGIIIEHYFHSNTKTAKWLTVNSNLKKVAQVEAKAITGKALPVKTASASISKGVYPASFVVKGRTCQVSGTIKGSPNISTVQVGIYSRSTGKAVSGHTYTAKNVGSTTFDLSKASSSLHINTLPLGGYYFRVTVTFENGIKKTLVNSLLNIQARTVGIINYTSPTTLKKGKGFNIRGTVYSTDYGMKMVNVGIISKTTKRWVQQAPTRNISGISFNVTKVNSKLKFGKLPKGKYYYVIRVFTTDGKVKTVLNKPFTVK